MRPGAAGPDGQSSAPACRRGVRARVPPRTPDEDRIGSLLFPARRGEFTICQHLDTIAAGFPSAQCSKVLVDLPHCHGALSGGCGNALD
jgi:hypothetical protein